MLPVVPENEVFSSSSSTPSSPNPNPLSHADRNNNRPENRATIDILEMDLLCDESFSEIMEDEEVVISDTSSKEIVISDASSTNYIGVKLNRRKRLRFDEEEDEITIRTIYDVNKLCRIHEEKGQKEYNEQNENQASEEEGKKEHENQESKLDVEEEDENKEIEK